MKNESKNIVLVWTSDLPQFLAENITAEKIIIAGERIEIPILMQLLNTKVFQEGKVSFFYAKNSEESIVREKVEIWFLGQAYASSSKLIVYGKSLDPYDFLTDSFAMPEGNTPRKERKKSLPREEKQEGVSIKKEFIEMTAGSVCGENPLIKGTVRKVTTCKMEELEKSEKEDLTARKKEDEISDNLQEEQTQVFNPVGNLEDLHSENVSKKERKKRTPKTEKEENVTTSGTKARAEVIKDVIMKSSLSNEDKKFFSTPGRLSMLEDVIKKSTRDTIKFQLHMMFGDRAGIIEETITDSWKDLETKLSSVGSEDPR